MSVEIDRETSGMESNSALGRCRLNVRIAAASGLPHFANASLKSATSRHRAIYSSTSSPAPENFFCTHAFHRKATLFLRQTVFGQVFGRGGMNNF